MSRRGGQRARRVAAWLGGGSLVVASAIYLGRTPEPVLDARRSMSLGSAMSPGDSDGFRRAEAPIEISFPVDHGPHPGFQTEWWYLVGNLQAASRSYGYQVTFFRSGLRPPEASRSLGDASPWATDDIFMAHLALTEVDDGRFHAFERFSRAALDLAGAQGTPLRVWLEDWCLEGSEESTFPLRLRAASAKVAVDLTLDTAKPPVLQGKRGWSRKGSQPGNASYYYSFTRLPTRGTLRIANRELDVTGDSWMDREWSTSALEEGQVGWDWFALQLSDARDLMVYRMRLAGERTDPSSSGVIVEADGSYRPLAVSDFELEVLEHWRSRVTGAEYPSTWRVASTVADVDLTVKPLVAAQEHTSSVVYWEGAVAASGRSNGRPVTGRGYLEMTGYEATGEPD